MAPPIWRGWRATPADVRDNHGVDQLAVHMKAKLARKRAEGYSGWDDPARCSVHHLARLLLDSLPKGDPVDVANFAMMLFNREGGAHALKLACALRDHDDVPPAPLPPEPRYIYRSGIDPVLAGAVMAGVALVALATGFALGSIAP